MVFIKDALPRVYGRAVEVLKEIVEDAGPLHPQYSYITSLDKEKSRIFWGAEYAVLLIGRSEFACDAAIAAERMQLMAHAHGVASGYNGNLLQAINGDDILREMIGISKRERVLACFALGHANVEYHGKYYSRNKKVSFI